jgi:hypothetical protein
LTIDPKERLEVDGIRTKLANFIAYGSFDNVKHLISEIRAEINKIDSEISIDEITTDLTQSLEPLTDIPDQNLDPPFPGEDTGPKSIASGEIESKIETRVSSVQGRNSGFKECFEL